MRRGCCSIGWVAAALWTISLAGSPAVQCAEKPKPDGAALYSKHCAGCHGSHGEGLYGPQLAGVVNEKYPEPDAMVALIQSGTPQGMPPFGRKLSEEEIRAIVEFVRSTMRGVQ